MDKKKKYLKDRINEIIDHYLMDEDEVRATVDMVFIRADGCKQEKHLAWTAPMCIAPAPPEGVGAPDPSSILRVFDSAVHVEEREVWRGSVWIPCKAKMPEDGQRVLICTGMKKLFVAAYNASAHMFMQRAHSTLHSWYDDEVTHWMPLPEPPGGEAS